MTSLDLHAMSVESFAPMLESLSAWLDKANPALVEARLAPDMYTLAQQVQQACHYAADALSRLRGQGAAPMPDAETSLAGLKAQIARTVAALRAADPAALDARRDCSIGIPGDMVIAFDGAGLLRAWSLPHFYFHVVTAYDILRHAGIALGKRDYLGQVGAFIRPK